MYFKSGMAASCIGLPLAHVNNMNSVLAGIFCAGLFIIINHIMEYTE